MFIILKIALRNIKEHKSKTVIIGMIISIGIAVLIIGNSMMDTATLSLKKIYIDNYTGHLVIEPFTDKEANLFGYLDMEDIQENVPVLKDQEKILNYLSTLPGVEEINPQLTGRATISYGEKGFGAAQIFGIDPESYFKMFPSNIQIIEGDFLKPDEQGIMLSESTKKNIEKSAEKTLKPGDKILLTGMSSVTGIKIREVEVKAVFRFKESNIMLDFVSLADAKTLRILTGLNGEAVSKADLTEKEKSLLGEVDEDALFGDESFFDQESITIESANEPSITNPVKIDAGTVTVENSDSENQGQWNFLLIKLKNDTDAVKITAKLNSYFKNNGIEAKAIDWVKAAGPLAEIANSIKIVFNIIILIIAIVAVIIIMNTLVISVSERLYEIGTMRAIGARKSFISRMIACETLIISFLFGITGIAAGCGLLVILNIVGIPAPNMFFEIIFGGKILKPVITIMPLLLSLAVVTAIGVASSLYPASIAVKIKPVKAMQSR